VEDSVLLGGGERVRLLDAYARLFPLRDGWEPRVRAWERRFVPLGDADPDLALCRRASRVFLAFSVLPARLRHPVEACTAEMASGMAAFAARRTSTGAVGLETRDQLAVYCHTVAGSVGTMLCRLFAETSGRIEPARLQRMLELAERFGLALQLVNIVQDVGTDARRGACYVPRQLAERHGLPAGAFLAAPPRQRRGVVLELAQDAVAALDAAAEFTVHVPAAESRIRMFCLLPLFLAIRTIGRVVAAPDGSMLRVKISRAQVRGAWLDAAAATVSNHALRVLYARRMHAVMGVLGRQTALVPAARLGATGDLAMPDASAGSRRS
jgi:farnesyl-diphosphate farnesyltransferase